MHKFPGLRDSAFNPDYLDSTRLWKKQYDSLFRIYDSLLKLRYVVPFIPGSVAYNRKKK
jgi:hypothetical protein